MTYNDNSASDHAAINIEIAKKYLNKDTHTQHQNNSQK